MRIFSFFSPTNIIYLFAETFDGFKYGECHLRSPRTPVTVVSGASVFLEKRAHAGWPTIIIIFVNTLPPVNRIVFFRFAYRNFR